MSTHLNDEFLSVPNTHIRVAAPKVESVNSKRLRGPVQVLVGVGHENRGTEFDRGKGLVVIRVYYSATYTPFSFSAGP